MNREEAQKLLDMTSIFRNMIVNSADDFESRTCGNCKHRKDEYCNNDDLWAMYGDYPSAHKDFGCNKFERKLD